MKIINIEDKRDYVTKIKEKKAFKKHYNNWINKKVELYTKPYIGIPLLIISTTENNSVRTSVVTAITETEKQLIVTTRNTCYTFSKRES